MTEIKSLADKLRSSIAEPIEKVEAVPVPKKIKPKAEVVPDILQQILDYDTSGHKTMVHARFDAKTAQMLNHFKMATGVENTRIAAFAVTYLFNQHPELKTLIKNYIQNLDI